MSSCVGSSLNVIPALRLRAASIRNGGRVRARVCAASLSTTAVLTHSKRSTPPAPPQPHINPRAAYVQQRGQTMLDKGLAAPNQVHLGRPDPPLVAVARAKTVSQRNIWESFLGRYYSGCTAAAAQADWSGRSVLDSKTRLYLSLALGCVALFNLYAGDYFVPVSEEELVAQAAGVLPEKTK